MVLRFFLFAGVFIFISCTEFERNHPDDPGGVNYQGKSASPSSSAQNSSSSAEISSSGTTSSSSLPAAYSSSSLVSLSSSSKPSSPNVACTAANNTSTQYCSNGVTKQYDFVTYEKQTYKTVVIGTQTWMAENLNYDANGSKCGNSDCDTYGRLYNWATAMALSASCNNSECQVGAKHKGICPSGWHIPSNAEWDVLNGGSLNAGMYLKATSGWDSYNGQSGNGEDTYGFSALPSGYGGSNGSLYAAGSYGYWWSSSQGGTYYVYGRYMVYDDDYFYNHDFNKSNLYSIRCVMD